MSQKECCSHESTVISHQNKIVIFLFFVGIAVSGLMLRLNPFPSDRAIWHTRVPPLKFLSVPYGTLHNSQF